MKNITETRLKELLDYDEDTGIFRWRVDEKRRGNGNGKIKGERAGIVNASYHRVIYIDGKMYPEHRLAWLWYYGAPVPKRITHINGDTEDNRIDNLKGTEEM